MVLIVNPLDAIITEQRGRFRDWYVVADYAFCEFGEGQQRLESIINPGDWFLNGHPEDFVNDKVIRFLLHNKKLAER